MYIYISVAPGYYNKEVLETVDEYIFKLSKKKNKLISQFEKLIKESAVDCNINFNANVYNDDENIICDI